MYVIKGQEVEKRDVTVGVKTGHHIEIKSGLFPNESVVTNGNYQLQYISVGGIQEHSTMMRRSHDEQEDHFHDDGHDHSDETESDNHDDHSDHKH